MNGWRYQCYLHMTFSQDVRLDAFLIMHAGFFAFICILLVFSVPVLTSIYKN